MKATHKPAFLTLAVALLAPVAARTQPLANPASGSIGALLVLMALIVVIYFIGVFLVGAFSWLKNKTKGHRGTPR